MTRPLRGRPSPSMVVALIALFVALGGTGYAALKLPKNSVGSAQLKKGAVTPKKVAKSTIKLFRGQAGATGATGLQGPKGDPGPPGAQGTPGAKGDTGGISVGSTLPSGQTETGVYSVAGITTGSYLSDAISFVPHVAGGVGNSNVQYIDAGSAGTANCPGPGLAAAGFLCIYSGANTMTTFVETDKPSGTSGADPEGTAIYFAATGSGAFNRGRWAVTAP